MGKTKVIELTAEQRAELEKGYRTGKSHCCRVRCQMILLKSEKRTSVEIGEVLGCCEMVVNNWLARYEERRSDGFGNSRGAADDRWLRPGDDGSFAKFKTKVKAIFNGIGSEYKIAFSQMMV
jgi:putative transposase